MKHYATCLAWNTGQRADCDCRRHRGWLIRKDDTQPLHAWRIFRRTLTGEVTPVMGASTFDKAVHMVNALITLNEDLMRGDKHVR